MTFQELSINEDTTLRPAFRKQETKTAWEVVLENNGPVMTIWFIVMLINMIALVILF